MLIVANWKMNGLKAESVKLIREIKRIDSGKNDVVICPSYSLLSIIEQELLGSRLMLGAQDCSLYENGAYTGDVSCAMLKDIGAKYVILGHSERRSYHAETDEIVKNKAKNAIENGLIPIICIGETLQERKDGTTSNVILKQIENSLPQQNSGYVIAYEPVWAIGTGLTPSNDEILEVHNLIAQKKPNIKILYGGSVNEENCHEIAVVENVSGFLVGGASLSAEKFGVVSNCLSGSY